MLDYTVKHYDARYADRKELKARLRELPDLIESARQLAEIEAKKKAARLAKAKPEKDWKAQWQEVADGLVVRANILKAYLKTFKGIYPVNEESVTVENNTFIFRPFYWNERVFLKLKCYTWEQAEGRS